MGTEAAVCWSRVATLIAERLGLHFPDDRLAELRRGFAAAADELGFADARDCARRLLQERLDPSQLRAVAGHLTIGETYFFRGEETFAALAGHVLPALVQARRRGKRLRVWSAACCTGEEAYSLAILLRQTVPDIDDWQLDLLATDINPHFLRKAVAGVYGQWSFRGLPERLRARWFRQRPDRRYEIAPEIRRMVHFAPMNLVDGGYPPPAGGGEAMDLILCRNVLMYFTPAQAARVVAGLRQSLRSDGWLVVAPCEVSQALQPDFDAVPVDGAILHRPRTRVPARPGAAPVPAIEPAPASAPAAPAAPAPVPAAARRRRTLPRPATGPQLPTVAAAARRRPGADADLPAAADPADAIARRAQALADGGRLAEALTCCDDWLAGHKLDARMHYLRAMVLTERGELTQARAALQRSLYLAPDNAVACVAAGNLERRLGRRQAAAGHYRHALELLERAPAGAGLPPIEGPEGITAAQLAAMVRDLLLAEAG